MDIEFDTNDVMGYVFKVCNDMGIQLNMTKAQKLLYCCYGTAIAAFDIKLTDEVPQAWQFGPVFPRAYNAIKKNKIDANRKTAFSEWIEKDENAHILEMFKSTIRYFGKYTASQLSAWSHAPDSPWDIATCQGTELLNPIPSDLIKRFFTPMIKDETA